MPARKTIDREAIARLNDEGLTGRQIAKQLGYTEHTIWRIRKELGISPGVHMTPERKAAIQHMVNDGWSWKEIERTEGANYDTMRRHFPGTAWTYSQVGEYRAGIRHVKNGPNWRKHPKKVA